MPLSQKIAKVFLFKSALILRLVPSVIPKVVILKSARAEIEIYPFHPPFHLVIERNNELDFDAFNLYHLYYSIL